MTWEWGLFLFRSGSDTPELAPARIDVGACLHAMNAEGRGHGPVEEARRGSGIACKQAPTLLGYEILSIVRFAVV